MAETISIQSIYDEIKKIGKEMATKKDVEALTDTIGIMSNAETMRQIKESEADIRKNRFKKITSIKDLIKEM